MRQLARIRGHFETLQGVEFFDGGKEVAEGIREVDWFNSAKAKSPCTQIESGHFLVEGKSVMVFVNQSFYGRAGD